MNAKTHKQKLRWPPFMGHAYII